MLGEGLVLESIISSSLENSSSTFVFTLMKTSPFRETEQHVEKKRAQNLNDDEVA
jgi:hypothetical protein